MAEANGSDPTVAAISFGSRPETDLLTVEELAVWLRLTPKGVYSLVEARRIPFVKVSNRLRFFAGEIQNWLRDSRVPASSEKTP
jgi:excisionase family DNA binding protein